MILQADHITHSFGTKQVLHDLTLELDSGEVVGLLGSNGAGKTTLLRIVTLLLPPDEGTLRFCDHPMTRHDLLQVGYLPEERGLYRHARAWEQALYFARLKGMSRSEAEQSLGYWFDRLGMTTWRNRKANQLSKGMQQRLQLAICIAHRPRLLILDEPFSGFDQAASAMLHDVVAELAQQGTAILLSTHNLAATHDLCHRTLTL